MYLEKKQLKFLKSLPKDGSISIENSGIHDMDMIGFLVDEKFISVEKELENVQLNASCHTYRNDGRIISVSRSPMGDAYLADIKIRKREKWISIVISVLALLKSYDVPDKIITLCRKLLELLQKLQ